MQTSGLRADIRTVITLAVPVVVENMLHTMLGTVDTYFAGQIHDSAIAAIGVTNLFVNILVAFFTAVSVGTTAVIARSIGRQDVAHANVAARQSVFLGIALGGGLGLLACLFCTPILRLTGAEPDVLEYAVPYFLIVVGPSVLLCLSQILSSCLRASKDTLSPMLANGFSNLLNIVLNALFIHMGLGIFGLGLATTLSRLVTLLLLTYRLSHGKSSLRLDHTGWQLDLPTLRSITRIGIPAGMERLFMRTGQFVYSGVILSLGTASYVAHNIGASIDNYAFIVAFGFSIAASTMVGVSLGENDPAAARRLTALAYWISAACVTLVGAVYFFGAPYLAAIFSDTPEVQQLVVSVLRLSALFQPLSALNHVMSGALQGAGDTKFPMYTTLLGIWVFRVGVGSLLAVPFGMGLWGFWMGCCMDNSLRGILLLIRFLRGGWQNIKI